MNKEVHKEHLDQLETLRGEIEEATWLALRNGQFFLRCFSYLVGHMSPRSHEQKGAMRQKHAKTAECCGTLG